MICKKLLTHRSAKASPYADKIELYRCMRMVLIPNKLAISQACCPPAPPKLARLRNVYEGTGKQRGSKQPTYASK